MLDFDTVKFPIDNQIENLYPLNFKLKAANTLVLETKNLYISNKVVELSSLIAFQYTGKIKLFKKDIRTLKNQEIISYRNKISIGGGRDPLFHNMSIINNVVLPLRVRDISESNIQQRVEELVMWLNLNNIIYKEVKNLNEYEYKFIQILRAIITNPKMLILINPLSLNSILNEKILKVINGLMSYKTSVLILENYNYNYQGFLKEFQCIRLNSNL